MHENGTGLAQDRYIVVRDNIARERDRNFQAARDR